MTSGIFFVQFTAGPRDIGSGLAVINAGCINGGDQTYLYRGRLAAYGGQAKATIEVTHYRGPLNSVLGPLRNFTLDLQGKVDEQAFDVQGTALGTSGPVIRIVGTKVAQLYDGEA